MLVNAEMLWMHKSYITLSTRDSTLSLHHRRGIVAPSTEALATEAALVFWQSRCELLKVKLCGVEAVQLKVKVARSN